MCSKHNKYEGPNAQELSQMLEFQRNKRSVWNENIIDAEFLLSIHCRLL